jgi:putative membrane protein
MTLTHRLALTALFAGAAAFAQTSSGTTGSPGTDTTGRPSTSTPSTSSTATGKTYGSPEASRDAAAAMSPSAVLSMIHQVNQDEIRLGKLGQTQAKSDKVRDYAKDMVDDHTALDKKLTDFVQNDGKGKVTLSASQIPAEKRSHMKASVDHAEQQLRGATGATFDREYMMAMEKNHGAVLRDLDAALPGLKGQDKIYDLVSSARDKVKDHHDHAKDILKDLDKTTATGGSGPATSGQSTTQPSQTPGK